MLRGEGEAERVTKRGRGKDRKRGELWREKGGERGRGKCRRRRGKVGEKVETKRFFLSVCTLTLIIWNLDAWNFIILT